MVNTESVKCGPKEVRMQNEVAAKDWFSHQNSP
jgi:hypothetical protein